MDLLDALVVLEAINHLLSFCAEQPELQYPAGFGACETKGLL